MRPRSAGTFLISRPETSAKLAARSTMPSTAPRAPVCAIEAYFEIAQRDLAVEQLREHVTQALRQEGAAAMDADDAEAAIARVALGNLVRDAGQRPVYVPLAKDDRGGAIGARRVIGLRAGFLHSIPSWPHGTRLKERAECIRTERPPRGAWTPPGRTHLPLQTYPPRRVPRGRTSARGRRSRARGRAPRSRRSPAAPRWPRRRAAPPPAPPRPRSGSRVG